ncbi:MAG: hypothetical protein A3F72_14305 [Bacteroidetes bacterium RIFCSPLOWO2_12_FULL_35_15]|nr:MAG: hypothetical protein A3F72_14305 [Bacteroidetes bacterium RIFCSPLOWO2_12_FULL_35_15]
METKTTILDPLLERAEIYGKTSIELIKLQALEKTTQIASHIYSRFIALFVFSMFFIMISIGAAIWLGNFLGKIYYGFLCVSGFYFILGGVIYFLMHNWIKKHVGNSIITLMLK